jgi:multisubunit Na+/H+ antiporter MnhG subunit
VGGIASLVIGAVMVVAGIAIVRFRTQIRDFTVNSEKATFGSRAGDAASRLQTPFWVGFSGWVTVVIGIVAITNGVITLVR